MPELPEVETIAAALKSRLLNYHFTRIDVRERRLREPLIVDKVDSILRSSIIDIRRRARYIIMELENRQALLIHLGMTGAFRIVSPETPLSKHEHCVFHLSDGNTLRYEDVRRFGYILHAILPKIGGEPKKLSGLGPEPLSRSFNAALLRRMCAGRNTAIKNMIMDNKIVVGVGNIYANESLFLSGIHPDTAAKDLSIEDCRHLVGNVKKVLRAAIKAGGTTISDFKSVDGSEGKFKVDLNVYGKKGAICPKCGVGGIERIVIGGRGSFFCHQCQPLF